LLVVSHPAVLTVNQLVYAALVDRGWDITLVVPSHWRHAYSGEDFTPRALPALQQALRPTRVVLRGQPQRYLYVTRCRRLARGARADVAFLEAEPFSLSAIQWGRALHRLGVPFGVQCYENIDRTLPAVVRAMRSRLLSQAAFVAARSPSAGQMARAWGAAGEVGLVPPAAPPWEQAAGAPSAAESRGVFTVGYAGRLVESKGVMDLLGAVRRLDAPTRLLLIGAGELASRIAAERIPGCDIEIRAGVGHDRMASAYAELDVLVLPSRTTPTWKEQFGRVIVEALSCGVPVIGSDSGEIPWLIGLTEGGMVFAEGDVAALADRLRTLRADPALRARLADAGRAAVARQFSVPAVTDALQRLLEGAAMRR
jgi:glycosyltransferase involved in cell wall biosynthesis